MWRTTVFGGIGGASGAVGVARRVALAGGASGGVTAGVAGASRTALPDGLGSTVFGPSVARAGDTHAQTARRAAPTALLAIAEL